MKFHYSIVIIIIIVYNIVYVNSQNNNYSQLNEKYCIDNILKLIYNRFNNDINYCQDYGLKCQDNYITQIIISNQENKNGLIKASDFTCLSRLNVLKLTNSNLDSTFLNGPFNPTLEILHLNNNNLNSNLPILLPGKGLRDIDISNNNLSGKISSAWCMARSNFSNNNNIIDYIPCCYSFFYNDPIVNSWFIGTSTKVDSYCLNYNFPKMNYDLKTNKTYLVGGYLGYSDESFYTVPNFKWIMERPGILYSCINCGLPQVFNITFPSAQNKTYTIANYESPPILNYYSIENKTLQGNHFGYNYNLITVDIEGIGKCTVKDSTFYSISIMDCLNNKELFDENKSYNIIISIGNQVSNYQVNPTSGKVCSNDKCNNHGICDLNNQGDCKCDNGWQSNTCNIPYVECDKCINGECLTIVGKCKCNDGWQSDSCDIPFKPCSQGCLYGKCINTTGECICNDGWQSNSCDTRLILCDQECEINGKCDNTTGTCNCFNSIKWFGKSCQYPYHFITTIEPASNLTNNIVSFIGWFGNKYYNNISVEISSIGNCNVTSINSTTLTCSIDINNKTLPQGIYGNASVTMNNFTWIGLDQYYFERSIKECPNNCSNQGKCIQGICQCFTNWIGFDCGTYYLENQKDNHQNQNINIIITNNGTTIFNIDQNSNKLYSDYQVFITNLVEVDIQGNTIAQYSLFNNWNLNSIKYTDILNNGRTLNFSQTLQHSKWFTSNIIMTIEEISYGRIENFVNMLFPLEPKSVKVSLSINNYQFSHSLNTLQLYMNSTLKTINNNNFKNSINKSKQSCYNSGNNITQIQSDQFNYFLILKENIKLYGRFINKIIADGRTTWISTSIQTHSDNSNLNTDYDDVIVKLNLPHCVSQCILDPDYQMLMDSILKISPECIDDSNDEKRLYLIAIIVVVSFIILSILVTIGILFYRKKYIENELQKKLKRLRENNFYTDSNSDFIFH